MFSRIIRAFGEIRDAYIAEKIDFRTGGSNGQKVFKIFDFMFLNTLKCSRHLFGSVEEC